MATLEETQGWTDVELVGADEEKLGTVTQVYLDRETGEPAFASVKTGMFGMRTSLVPIMGAQRHGEHVHVPYTKDQIKDAPNLGSDEEISSADEQRLYEHYGLAYAGTYDGPDHAAFGDAAGMGAGDAAGMGAGGAAEMGIADRRAMDTADTARFGTDDAAMTRSEEELRVSTRNTEAGRARLRKFIVTENVSQTVPVTHEEARIEREPITDANRDAAMSGAEITEEEHEVTLHAQEPVVEKQVVPKERVRLTTDAIEEQTEVNETLRKEQIETEGDGPNL